MENFALAMSKYKRHRFDECIKMCDEMLKHNDSDLAVQLLKTHAIRKKNFIDDLEIDDESLGDKILDEYKVTNNARPGTSFQGTGSKGINQAVRPMSSSGRPISGVVRPNSRAMSRENSKGGNRLSSMSGQNTRLVTSGGRNVRIATATLQSLNSSMTLNVNDINPKSLVKKKSLAKVSKIIIQI
jgi:tetratricopeptide repeat protein 8